MYSKLASVVGFSMLSTFTVPALAHSGHTSIPHIHGVLELLLAIVVAFIIYRIVKN